MTLGGLLSNEGYIQKPAVLIQLHAVLASNNWLNKIYKNSPYSSIKKPRNKYNKDIMTSTIKTTNLAERN